MSEHPIIFSGEMVRAILDGRKTVTRRVIKPQPVLERGIWRWQPKGKDINVEHINASLSPYGQPGDLLWVRETWMPEELEDGLDGIRYKADLAFQGIDDTQEASDAWLAVWKERQVWRPSIHMPRWASRLTREVTDVSAERLQQISVADCLAEGTQLPVDKEGRPLLAISGKHPPSAYLPEGAIEPSTLKLKDEAAYIRAHFASLWDSINAKPKPAMHNPWGAPEKCQVAYPWDDVQEVTTINRKASPWHDCKVYVCGNPWTWPVRFKRRDQ